MSGRHIHSAHKNSVTSSGPGGLSSVRAKMAQSFPRARWAGGMGEQRRPSVCAGHASLDADAEVRAQAAWEETHHLAGQTQALRDALAEGGVTSGGGGVGTGLQAQRGAAPRPPDGTGSRGFAQRPPRAPVHDALTPLPAGACLGRPPPCCLPSVTCQGARLPLEMAPQLPGPSSGPVPAPFPVSRKGCVRRGLNPEKKMDEARLGWALRKVIDRKELLTWTDRTYQKPEKYLSGRYSYIQPNVFFYS